MHEIKHNLRRQLTKSGIKLSELERVTGISHPTIARMFNESDTSSPDLINLIAVVKVLGVSLDNLVGISDTVPTEQTLSDTTINAYNDLITEKEKQISLMQRQIADKERLITEKDTRIANLSGAWNEERRDKRILSYIVVALIGVVVALCVIAILRI